MKKKSMTKQELALSKAYQKKIRRLIGVLERCDAGMIDVLCRTEYYTADPTARYMRRQLVTAIHSVRAASQHLSTLKKRGIK